MIGSQHPNMRQNLINWLKLETLRESFRGEPCKEDLAAPSRSLHDQLASRKRADGTALLEASLQRLKNFAEAVDAQMVECDAMQFQGIDHPMTGKRVIDLGGRTVELSFLGRGNTAGDVVAYIPDAKVVLTVDLVVHPFPFATQSYISEWAAVLRALDRMEFTQLVPGHGPVMRDRTYLHDVTAVLAAIDSQARAAYKSGMTAEELRVAIDLSSFSERFAHGDPFIKANFDAQVKGPAIERMWQQLSGEWKPEGEAATATGSSAKRP